MLVKIIIALSVLPAMISLGMFDYDQNMKNLDSIAGSVAFTYGGVALMFISERCHNFLAKVAFVIVGLLCAGQSGLFNYDAQMKPHREQQNVRKLIEYNESKLHPIDYIQKCFKLPDCRSEDYRDENRKTNSRLLELKDKIDYSWVDPDQTTKIKTYGVALLTPLLMNVLAFGLSFTFFQEKRKKNVSAMKKLVNWLVRRNASGVNGNVSDVNGVNGKSSYTNDQYVAMKNVYEKMFYDRGGVEPTQNKWHAELKKQYPDLKLKRHDKVKDWWETMRPNLEPPPAPEQPRPIEVYTSRPAGFTGIH